MQRRGQERREAILAAALRVVAERGADNMTHRGVAAAAGVPLAATTYYFASRDDLLEQTLKWAVERELAVLTAWRPPASRRLTPRRAAREVVDLLMSMWGGDLPMQRAYFELWLQVARRPQLAGLARRVNEAYRRVDEDLMRALGSRHPKTDAHLLTTAVDGLLLEQLGEQALDETAFRRLVERLFTLCATDATDAADSHTTEAADMADAGGV